MTCSSLKNLRAKGLPAPSKTFSAVLGQSSDYFFAHLLKVWLENKLKDEEHNHLKFLQNI